MSILKKIWHKLTGRFDKLLCLVAERSSEENDRLEIDNFMLGILVGIEIAEHKHRILNEQG